MEQQSLSIKYDPANTPRPRWSDQRTVRDGLSKLLPAVRVWLENSGESDDEVLADLLAAWASEQGGDGYKLARYLEQRHHWDVDMELAEIMDNASSYISQAHRALVVAWRKQVDLNYPPVGSRVKGTVHGSSVEGEVIRLDDEVGCCVVRCEGQAQQQGWLLNAEDLSLIAQSEVPHA